MPWSLTRSARATRPSHTHTRTQVLHTHTHTGTQEHQARTRHDGRSEQQDQLVSPQRCSPVSTRPSNMCSACMDADWSVRLRVRVRQSDFRHLNRPMSSRTAVGVCGTARHRETILFLVAIAFVYGLLDCHKVARVLLFCVHCPLVSFARVGCGE